MYKMKPKGFTLVELVIVIAILAILCSIAIPNFISFRCLSEGRKMDLDRDLVSEVCNRCIGCEHEDTSPTEALQMIKDGVDSSRFIEWELEPTIETNREPIERSWKD